MTEEKEPNGTTTAVAKKPTSLIHIMASKFSLEPERFMTILKGTVFNTKELQSATNEEIAAFLAIAHEHGMNPFVGEIFAFPHRGTVKPIISVDGWLRKVNEHPAFDGMEFVEVNDEKTGKPISVTITIYRKDRSRPLKITEYYKECYRETDPWKLMPHRMLQHKALRQGARYAFGFASVFDEDYYRDMEQSVGGHATERAIAAATANKAEALKEKIGAAKAKQIEAQPELPAAWKPVETAPAVESPLAAGPAQTAEVGNTAPPSAPEPPSVKVVDDVVISKADRDALVAIVLEKPGVTKESAQAAMRATLTRYGYTKTTDIKYKDYAEILEWAKDWEGDEL